MEERCNCHDDRGPMSKGDSTSLSYNLTRIVSPSIYVSTSSWGERPVITWSAIRKDRRIASLASAAVFSTMNPDSRMTKVGTRIACNTVHTLDACHTLDALHKLDNLISTLGALHTLDHLTPTMRALVSCIALWQSRMGREHRVSSG